MSNRVSIGNLEIARELHDLVASEITPGTGVEPARFWQAFEAILADLVPKNRALLAGRDEIQAKLDAWHREHRDDFDFAAYRDFLVEVGYLSHEEEGPLLDTEDFQRESARAMARAIRRFFARYPPGTGGAGGGER
jgi:malate synthase